MNLAIYTTDLTQANAHLMPWRTVLEVAKGWQRRGEHVSVLSGGTTEGVGTFDGVRVFHVPRPKTRAAQAVAEQILTAQGVERLYFPVAPGRVNTWARDLPQRNRIGLVWYMPGAWYSVRQVWCALRYLGAKATLPYAVQALWPKRWWIGGLLGQGVVPLITMTGFTAGRMVGAGYPREAVRVIPPGKDVDVHSQAEVVAACFKRLQPHLEGQPYFLFFGPPNPIRGVVQLIAAFKRLAAVSAEGRLVCLFRADSNVDARPVRRLVEEAGLQDRLLPVWDSVNSADLNAFLRHAHAIVKPFLIVPSEIPLAVIEAAQHGKPVVGFAGDGTGEFISSFGVTAPQGSAEGLSEALRSLLTNEALYRAKCRDAQRVYAEHPAWEHVADQWLRVAGSDRVRLS